MISDTFKKAYAGLNPAQKKAVDTIEGPVMVNAGPGTGKTQILTLRIAQILKKTDTKPEQILALTFTNSGVYAMRERLLEMIGDEAYRVNIFTFHAFAEHIIKNFNFYFPRFEYARVIDDLEKAKIIESILDTHQFEHLITFHDRYRFVQDITRAINEIKKEGYNPEQFKKMIPVWEEEMLSDENIVYKKKFKTHSAGDIKPAEKEKIEKKVAKAYEISQVFSEYQTAIIEKNLYDFSDMILVVLAELRTNENLKSDLQEQYQYLLVDEHQDTNAGQNELVEHLTDAEHLDRRPNIFTVGDEKQSIYRFQGASEETFSRFHALFDNIATIPLIENYRSTQHILSGAHGVIEHSLPEAIALHSNVKNSEEVPIQISQFSNYKFELLHIAQGIQEKIKAGVAPEEIAIIFRSNKHTQDIKSVLAHHGIPFTIFSKNSVFEDIDISHLIYILKAIHNPHDEEYLAKSLFIDFLKLDVYDTIKILGKRYAFAREGKTLFDMLSSEAILTEIGVQHVQEFTQYTQALKNLMVQAHNARFSDFLKNMLAETGYISYMLGSALSQSKLLKVDKLFDEVKKQQAKGLFGLTEFITLVDSYHAYHLDIENKNPEIETGVQLMTAHGSKGKEFEHVYLINTTRSNWEKNRGIPSITLPIKNYKGDVHDERRLFYVAMTRAKKMLHISFSKSDWEGKEQEKSQFISEIPDEHTEHIDTKKFESDQLQSLDMFIQPYNEMKTIWDVNFLKELYLKRGLNTTALNNYMHCPLKYFYKNLIQLPSTYTNTLLYGNAMHATLEKFFMQCVQVEKILENKVLQDIFSKEIQFLYLPQDDQEKYLERGLEALNQYYLYYKDDFKIQVALEQNITRTIELSTGETLRLTGKLDKIEFLDSPLEGLIRVLDYKTGSPYSQKSKEQRQDLDRQLLFYFILLDGYRDGAYVVQEAVLDFVEKNKKDVFEQHAVCVDENQKNDLLKTIEDVSQEILSGEFLSQGCNKKDCEWCQMHQGV